MQPVRMGRGKAEELEQAHVYSVYDQIADSFSKISQKAWPNVRRFLKQQPPGSLIADIGCGNGRYLHINKNIYKVGLDICCPLVEAGKVKGYEVLIADNLKLPFRCEAFDAVISIGVLHHFATGSRRIEAIQELARILKPGGQMMIYVWAFEQKHRKFDGQDVLVPWHESQRNNSSGTQRTFSDKDLSSISSFSEDESSLDTVDEIFTCVDNFPMTNGANSHHDDVFHDVLKKEASVSAKCLTYQRSSTLPNLIEDNKRLKIRGMKNFLNARNRANSSSVLIEECRKIEASLSAMTAKHIFASSSSCPQEIHHKNINKEEATILEQPVLLSSMNKKQVPTKESHFLSSLPSSESLTTLKQLRTQEYVLQLSDPVSQNGDPDDDLDSYIMFETHPQSSCFPPEQKHFVFPPVYDTSGITDIPNMGTNAQSKHNAKDKCRHPEQEKPKKKASQSFFGNLKQRVIKFFDKDVSTHEENSVGKVKSCMLPQSLINQMITMEGFAVREFPMSSFPLSNKYNEQTSRGDIPVMGKDVITSGTDIAAPASKFVDTNNSREFADGFGADKKVALLFNGHDANVNGLKGIQLSGAVEKTVYTESQNENTDLKSLPCRTILPAKNQQVHHFANGSSECHGSACSSEIYITGQKYSSMSKNSNVGTLSGCEKSPSDLCRFYHVFREGELVKMIKMNVPNLRVVQCIYDHANWCVIAEKLDD